jgi:proteasome beta subunit
MTNDYEALKKGTTTIGIVGKDCVVMGTEKRATMGTMIAHKTTQKLFKIDNHIGLAVAGLVGDAQILARYLTAEAELYRLKHETGMTIKAASTLMANILSARRMDPYWVQLLIGGIDAEGGHIYSLDPAGGSIEDKYVSAGSGSPFAYGVLEDYYKDNLGTDKCIELVIRSLTIAMSRDSASGNGANIAVISKDKFEELSEKEIEDRKAKLGIK